MDPARLCLNIFWFITDKTRVWLSPVFKTHWSSRPLDHHPDFTGQYQTAINSWQKNRDAAVSQYPALFEWCLGIAPSGKNPTTLLGLVSLLVQVQAPSLHGLRNDYRLAAGDMSVRIYDIKHCP